MGFSTIITNCA